MAFSMVEDMDLSILAALGGLIAPIFTPLGFGTWQPAVATVMGLVAKEEVVGVFGVLFGVAGDALAMVDEGAFEGLSAIAAHLLLFPPSRFCCLTCSVLPVLLLWVLSDEK